MKLKAFTLAEMLITMAIIGIVAALTIPTLMSDMNKRRTGAALSKAINTLTNNNKTLIVESDVTSLTDICGNYSNSYWAGEYYLRNCLGKTTPLSEYYGTFLTKDGIGFSSYGWSGYSSAAPSNIYGGTYTSVLVDINGSKSPNTMGKDRFLVWVDSKGSVIPYGGGEYMVYWTGSGSSYSAPWRSYCNEWYVSRPEYCAGAIADNNYVVNFKYN